MYQQNAITIASHLFDVYGVLTSHWLGSLACWFDGPSDAARVRLVTRNIAALVRMPEASGSIEHEERRDPTLHAK